MTYSRPRGGLGDSVIVRVVPVLEEDPEAGVYSRATLLDETGHKAPARTAAAADRAGEPGTHSIVMRFEVGAFFFGSASDSTPLSILALTLDSSTSEANVKLRATVP